MPYCSIKKGLFDGDSKSVVIEEEVGDEHHYR